MKWISVFAIMLAMTGIARAEDDRPLVQQFLNRGDLLHGEQALELALARQPDDDQIRFSLGILQLAQSIERLGQSLYTYGIRSEQALQPILRLPVPPNPDPAPISYTSFRRVLDDFARDLSDVEATLKEIKSDEVVLPIRLAEIQLDLTSDGDPSEPFVDLIKRVVRSDLAFLQDNPDFLIRFDRGDVAWLRAYCHLLQALVDIGLTFDTRPGFEAMATRIFPKVVPVGVPNAEPTEVISTGVSFVQPHRLARARLHLIEVVHLNHETWKHIRAETDDDHEWLPSARQKQGVLGLPVQDEMIDAWLAMADEFKALLEGERSLLPGFWGKPNKGLDLKTWMDDPPTDEMLRVELFNAIPDKYLSDAKNIDVGVFLRVGSMLQNTTGVGYAAWFN